MSENILVVYQWGIGNSKAPYDYSINSDKSTQCSILQQPTPKSKQL